MNSNLHELITYLEYGTKLHVAVLMLGNYGGTSLSLPHERTIHSASVCNDIKSRVGYKKCKRCRDAAIRLAIRGKKAFGGICINGIYEYTRPVIIENDVAAIIFIGNIRPTDDSRLRQSESYRLIDTTEDGFDFKKCDTVGRIIEDYIVSAIEKYPKKTDTLVDNLKAYIDANIEYSIDMSLLATIFHYNERYLGRLFKKQTGITISEYVNERRVAIAKKLLKKNGDTVDRIAARCGFKNTTYFNRVFKAVTGTTPTDFKSNAMHQH